MNAADWDRRYRERPSLWTAEPNRFLVEVAGTLRPGRALALACGEGRNALWLARNGWHVLGVDFSAVAIDRARASAAEMGLDAGFEVADLLEWSPMEQTYDLVTVLYLQLPLPDVATVVRRAAGAVAPGGTLLVVAHHRDNLDHGHGGPSTTEVLYTEDDVAGWVPDLVVARCQRIERPVATDGGTATALDALFVARRPAAG